MGLDRGKNWWWNYFKNALFSLFRHTRGYITLANGLRQVEISLDASVRIKKIFVAVEAEGIPVCAGNVDMVGAVRKDDTTFIIFADIKSNTAVVYWLVEYDNVDPEDIDNV